MTSRFAEELETLKDKLLDELDSLQSNDTQNYYDRDHNHDQEHNAKSGIYSDSHPQQCIQLMQQFESLLNSAIVSLNQEFRPLRVVWERPNTLDNPYNLRVIGNNSSNTIESPNFLHYYDNLLQLVDWFYQFKLSFRTCLLQVHEAQYAKIDKYRNEAIEAHSIDLRPSNSTTSLQRGTGTTNLEAMSKSAMTKSTLLTQTKKLTNRLTKSNQMLQSGILQSELNLDELRQQTKTLELVGDKYNQFQVVFDKTSELVKSLEKASNKEKRDVYLSLGFLVACIAWVIWRRILKLPVKMALWLCFKFFKGILVAIGLVRRGQYSTDTVKVVTGAVSSHSVAATVTAMTAAVSVASDIIETAIIETTILESNTTTTTSLDIISSLDAMVSDAVAKALSHDEL